MLHLSSSCSNQSFLESIYLQRYESLKGSFAVIRNENGVKQIENLKGPLAMER